MKPFRFVFISVVVALLVLIGGQAKADYINLFIEDNLGNIVTASSNTGFVTYAGPVGPNFTVNNVSGTTYPGLSSQSKPDLDLLSINVNSTGVASTLFIALSATGYTVPTGPNIEHFGAGGTGHNNIVSIEWQAWYGALNNFINAKIPPAPAGWTQIATIGPVAGPFPDVTQIGGHDDEAFNITASPFALAIVTILDTNGVANVSYNSEVTTGKVPEPMSLILLGGGLAGAGLYRRLRKPKG